MQDHVQSEYQGIFWSDENLSTFLVRVIRLYEAVEFNMRGGVGHVS